MTNFVGNSLQHSSLQDVSDSKVMRLQQRMKFLSEIFESHQTLDNSTNFSPNQSLPVGFW